MAESAEKLFLEFFSAALRLGGDPGIHRLPAPG
jgi:hypothetical protein